MTKEKTMAKTNTNTKITAWSHWRHHCHGNIPPSFVSTNTKTKTMAKTKTMTKTKTNTRKGDNVEGKTWLRIPPPEFPPQCP